MTKLKHHKTGRVENFPELIDLQSAHVTQHNGSGSTRTDWNVEKNVTNEHMTALPGRLNESEVFAIMRFAKKYELIAFNAGINMQKGKQNAFLKETIKTLQANNRELADENIRLANILESWTQKGN